MLVSSLEIERQQGELTHPAGRLSRFCQFLHPRSDRWVSFFVLLIGDEGGFTLLKAFSSDASASSASRSSSAFSGLVVMAHQFVPRKTQDLPLVVSWNCRLCCCVSKECECRAAFWSCVRGDKRELFCARLHRDDSHMSWHIDCFLLTSTPSLYNIIFRV